MLNRKQKENLVQEVSEDIIHSKALTFVSFKGLTVSETQEVKKTLRASGVKYRVLKKKLFDLSAKKAGITASVSNLEGQIAIAFSLEDEVSGAKILHEFSKKHENLVLAGGVLEGKNLSKEEVVALAKIPSKQELLSKLVGSIQMPVSGFVRVLSGNMRGLAVVLKAISEQKA